MSLTTVLKTLPHVFLDNNGEFTFIGRSKINFDEAQQATINSVNAVAV